jgi:hypothetical protein
MEKILIKNKINREVIVETHKWLASKGWCQI